MSHTDSLELYYLCLQKSSEIQKKRHLEAYGRKDEKVPTGKVFLMVRNQNNSNNINCNSNNSNNNSNSSSPTQQQQQQQQQQRSNQANSSRYKTELCRPFEENGVCKYGDKCQFAHGYQELRNLQRHPKYKTELCRSFHTTGFCPYGPRCHFIHNSEESKQSMLSTLSIYLLR